MLVRIPYQKFYFYHLPTRGRAGIKLVYAWYVSNVSINYELFMLLYYHSWMFYNHFIATLYHFLGLTYWPSAQCQLLFFACFLHRRKSIPNGVQTLRNFLWIFYGPEDIHWAREAPGGCPEGGTTHQGAPGGPGAPRWVVPTSVASRTPSSPYKFLNIPKTLRVNLDQKFHHRKAL